MKNSDRAGGTRVEGDQTPFNVCLIAEFEITLIDNY